MDLEADQEPPLDPTAIFDFQEHNITRDFQAQDHARDFQLRQKKRPHPKMEPPRTAFKPFAGIRRRDRPLPLQGGEPWAAHPG